MMLSGFSSLYLVRMRAPLLTVSLLEAILSFLPRGPLHLMALHQGHKMRVNTESLSKTEVVLYNVNVEVIVVTLLYSIN